MFKHACKWWHKKDCISFITEFFGIKVWFCMVQLTFFGRSMYLTNLSSSQRIFPVASKAAASALRVPLSYYISSTLQVLWPFWHTYSKSSSSSSVRFVRTFVNHIASWSSYVRDSPTVSLSIISRTKWLLPTASSAIILFASFLLVIPTTYHVVYCVSYSSILF